MKLRAHDACGRKEIYQLLLENGFSFQIVIIFAPLLRSFQLLVHFFYDASILVFHR